jgi:hypothetical protein
MTLRINFRHQGNCAVKLELFSNGVWKSVCEVNMCALEDNDLAREIPETDTFEPVVYLRCLDLPDGEIREIQHLLDSGLISYCRLQSASAVVTEGLHFKVLRMREIYRCPEFFDETGEESEKNLRFKFRWMITGINADLEFGEKDALLRRELKTSSE